MGTDGAVLHHTPDLRVTSSTHHRRLRLEAPEGAERIVTTRNYSRSFVNHLLSDEYEGIVENHLAIPVKILIGSTL